MLIFGGVSIGKFKPYIPGGRPVWGWWLILNFDPLKVQRGFKKSYHPMNGTRNLPKLNSNKKTHANTPNQPWPNTNHASIFWVKKNIIFDVNHSGVQKNMYVSHASLLNGECKFPSINFIIPNNRERYDSLQQRTSRWPFFCGAPLDTSVNQYKPNITNLRPK